MSGKNTLNMKKYDSLMETINLNTEVIIYPNEKGWEKLVECQYNLYAQYGIQKKEDAKRYVESKRTQDDGFKEQLWVLMQTYHDMFFNGTPYWENMNLKIVPDPFDVFLKEQNKPKNKIKKWLKKLFK